MGKLICAGTNSLRPHRLLNTCYTQRNNSTVAYTAVHHGSG